MSAYPECPAGRSKEAAVKIEELIARNIAVQLTGPYPTAEHIAAARGTMRYRWAVLGYHFDATMRALVRTVFGRWMD